MANYNLYKKRLEKYDIEIGIEVGSKDFPVLLSGVRELSKTLKKDGIDHKYEEYNGDHGNKLHLRVENNLFQFFSEYFDD